MSVRAQTVRRLSILLAAVLVVVGIGAALYWRNEHQKNVRLAEARQAGMTAYEAGDYRAALDSLKLYVAKPKGKEDAEALYAYGVSRARLEESNGKHISEGIMVFNALLQLDPGHVEAKHRLLDLLPRAGRNPEAIELADRVLVENPQDLDALKAKVLAHSRQREFEKALAASEKLNEINPTDLDQQLLTYELLRKLNTPPQGILHRAQKQQQANPNDPRFQLLLAMALGHAGKIDEGKQWLSKASTQPAPDAAFVQIMVRVFDQMKMYGESEGLLRRVTDETKDPLVFRVAAQRLWQNGQNGQVIKLLEAVDPANEKSDTGLLAYKGLALFETGKREEARAIVTKLAARQNDNEAAAWATALGARFTATEPKVALGKYQEALVRSPDNPIIRFLVGEAYARLGETELAITAWKQAAELSPSWATPRVDIARMLAGNGRIREALEHAQAAVRAAPTQIAAAVTLANILHKAIEEMGGDAEQEKRLFTLVEQIQKAEPGEPETMPLYVDLLAKAKRRDEAIAAVRNAMKGKRPLNQATALRLTAVSRQHNLGLEEELKAVGIDGGPDTPRLALARAADLASTGRPLDGLALLEDKAKSATTQPVQWQLALTQYKELIRDPDARGEWIELGERNPNDLSVQQTILKHAGSARNDREFIARTINRVKDLTGAEGQTWKIERARWLLDGGGDDAGVNGKDAGKDTAEAINTLTEIVRTSPTHTDARMLLASAYERVNNIPGAIKELQAAAVLEPNSAAVALEVARLLQSQNKFADARTYLERAAATPDLSADTRRRIASMLASQGDYTRATKILLDAGNNLDARGKALLADIFRREGRLTDAEGVYRQLLAQSDLDVDTIRGAADFYAATGKIDEAKKVLARLGETNARPGQAELIQASFTERHVGPDAARDLYVAAAKATPTDPVNWRHLVAYHLRASRYENAQNAADEGIKSIGRDDAVVRRLHAAARTLVALSAQKPALRPTLAILAAAAPEDRGASEFLASPQANAATMPSDDALLARLKNIAGLYPRSMPLQAALVQWFVARKEFSEAGQAATRMMEAFPNDPDPARVAASVYRAAGQHEVAVSAINKWRERSPENALQADAMIADIRLSQGDAASAARVLQPHQAILLKDPSKQATLTTLLRAMAQSGRERDARQILEPTIARERASRAIWLGLAANDIKDPNVAEQWIRQVAPMIPADAAPEQTALGSAWYHLSVRARDGRGDAATAEAIKVLDPVLARSDAPVDAVLLRAALADRAGDQKLSEELYRRGLKIRPDQPEALNNLAYLIVLRDGDVNEAKQLSQRAVKLAPSNASFYDTLGRVQNKAGDRDAAIASFKKAIDLEPNNVEALIGLATVFTDAGKRDAAAALLPQIDTLLKARPMISAPVRRELDALRAEMKASL
jgi:tetratricopeptide (TPR) repeat protein